MLFAFQRLTEKKHSKTGAFVWFLKVCHHSFFLIWLRPKTSWAVITPYVLVGFIVYNYSSKQATTLVCGPCHVSGGWLPTLTMEVWVQTQTTPCGICGGQSGAGTGFSLSTVVLPCQYHSTSAPGLFIFLSLTLCNVSSWQHLKLCTKVTVALGVSWSTPYMCLCWRQMLGSVITDI
jgi:hypothetical protein